ncbi:unnamed protein product [Mucor hiemalis]
MLIFGDNVIFCTGRPLLFFSTNFSHQLNSSIAAVESVQIAFQLWRDSKKDFARSLCRYLMWRRASPQLLVALMSSSPGDLPSTGKNLLDGFSIGVSSSF